MADVPEEIATAIERRHKELTLRIDELAAQQGQAQSQIYALQVKRDSTDKPRIEELKIVRDEITDAIGHLARERTDLVDGLPIMITAAKEIDVLAGELGKNAQTIQRAVKKLERATKAVQTAESLIIRTGSLLKSIAA